MLSEIDFNGFKLMTGEVSILVFNMPKVNVLSTPVLNDFIRALEMLRPEKGVKVLIITGKGTTFMAGGDIREMSGFGPEEAAAFSRLFHSAMETLECFPKPVIAAVNGFALGGGCELMLVCDIAIASDIAVFGQPEVTLGIIPGVGGVKRLIRRIGGIMARELIFTGKRIYAGEALSMGLVNRVVPLEKLAGEVMKLARGIADKPAQCIEAAKTLTGPCSSENEIELFSRMFSYDDQKRLMDDFITKM